MAHIPNAHLHQLPCGGDGLCMLCHLLPSDEDKLICSSCATPWHTPCLSSGRPETLADMLRWECPDCTILPAAPSEPCAPIVAHGGGEAGGLVAKIRAIEADASLSDQEKARRRQELLSGKVAAPAAELKKKNRAAGAGGDDMNCQICINMLDRPVTTPCGHNFCLKCFQKWIAQGKRICATCRGKIPAKMAAQPRINATVVAAIRMLNLRRSMESTTAPQRVFHFVANDMRPDKAYTTERAKRNGKANAASGKIFVTVAPDHFGPILAENDPERNLGVAVGDSWEDRMECRQWGAHRPHIAGIAGQSRHGAQSVVLSGGYKDDEDHGEWFLYTGSGGKDLKGNKRTNKDHSFDQEFDLLNQALRLSCCNGYPVRVVRSHKEKRSSYAPVKGLRYDGIYRIEKCWRKIGSQGFKVCRYLFVRCDNAPAPWTSDTLGDRPRTLPVIPELKVAFDLTQRKESPSWDYVEEEETWKWTRPPPPSKLKWDSDHDYVPRRKTRARASKRAHIEKLLKKEFSCLVCQQVLTDPVTTPCAHNFCKTCLLGVHAGKSAIRERNRGGRMLRTQKNYMKCPACPADVSDYIQNPQVNRELTDAIESLKNEAADDQVEEEEEEEEEEEDDASDEDVDVDVDDEDDDDDDEEEEEKQINDEEAVAEDTIKQISCEIENVMSISTNDDAKVGDVSNVKPMTISTNDDARVGEVSNVKPKRKYVRKAKVTGEEATKVAPAAPKRRGRPPKKQQQEVAETSIVCHIGSENGNNDDEEMVMKSSAPKRRGRPPKNPDAPKAKRSKKLAEGTETEVLGKAISGSPEKIAETETMEVKEGNNGSDFPAAILV